MDIEETDDNEDDPKLLQALVSPRKEGLGSMIIKEHFIGMFSRDEPTDRFARIGMWLLFIGLFQMFEDVDIVLGLFRKAKQRWKDGNFKETQKNLTPVGMVLRMNVEDNDELRLSAMRILHELLGRRNPLWEKSIDTRGMYFWNGEVNRRYISAFLTRLFTILDIGQELRNIISQKLSVQKTDWYIVYPNKAATQRAATDFVDNLRRNLFLLLRSRLKFYSLEYFLVSSKVPVPATMIKPDEKRIFPDTERIYSTEHNERPILLSATDTRAIDEFYKTIISGSGVSQKSLDDRMLPIMDGMLQKNYYYLWSLYRNYDVTQLNIYPANQLGGVYKGAFINIRKIQANLLKIRKTRKTRKILESDETYETLNEAGNVQTLVRDLIETSLLESYKTAYVEKGERFFTVDTVLLETKESVFKKTSLGYELLESYRVTKDTLLPESGDPIVAHHLENQTILSIVRNRIAKKEVGKYYFRAGTWADFRKSRDDIDLELKEERYSLLIFFILEEDSSINVLFWNSSTQDFVRYNSSGLSLKENVAVFFYVTRHKSIEFIKQIISAGKPEEEGLTKDPIDVKLFDDIPEDFRAIHAIWLTELSYRAGSPVYIQNNLDKWLRLFPNMQLYIENKYYTELLLVIKGVSTKIQKL